MGDFGSAYSGYYGTETISVVTELEVLDLTD